MKLLRWMDPTIRNNERILSGKGTSSKNFHILRIKIDSIFFIFNNMRQLTSARITTEKENSLINKQLLDF